MIDIVIVNWNSGQLVTNCVRSIIENDSPSRVSKIFVIDNNSQDQSALNLSAIDSRIYLVQNNENLGFAKACNQGFKLCTSSYVLLLNPDAMLLKNTLEDCVNYMQQHQDIDILGCRLLDDHGLLSPSCSRFPSPKRILFDAIGLSKIAPRTFKPGTIMTDWDHKENRFVDQVMGAFMFMRLACFTKIGLFDERFFVYYEEVDFSKRLTEQNGRIFYNQEITAVHSGEGTTKSIKGFRLFLSLRSRLQYAQKHFSTFGYFVVWVSTYFVEPFSRIAFAVLKRNLLGIKEVFKAYRLLIAGHNPAPSNK
ncbi:MAG: hypothetical protein RLY16_271 [Bacteroidota bacterium]